MIEFKNVQKKYKNKIIFENIQLTLHQGIYLICGENGSGKSTFLKLIKGFSKPTKGIVKVNGEICYIPEKIHFPNFLTINEVIDALKKIYRSQIEENILLSKYDIIKYKDYKLNSISKGTYQKLLLIISQLRDFNIYLFDEPLNGLDNESVKIFMLYLQELVNKNKLIIISSHLKESYKALPIQTLNIINKSISKE